MSNNHSPKTENKLAPAPEIQKLAMYIASVVRNSMEDFHCQNLTDEQMKELNPIIRNAIYTALYARENYTRFLGAEGFVDFSVRCIPKYWEDPALTDDFLETVKYFERKQRNSPYTNGFDGRRE